MDCREELNLKETGSHDNLYLAITDFARRCGEVEGPGDGNVWESPARPKKPAKDRQFLFDGATCNCAVSSFQSRVSNSGPSLSASRSGKAQFGFSSDISTPEYVLLNALLKLLIVHPLALGGAKIMGNTIADR